MNRHRIIVLLVALLMVGFLYFLPRVVVDNDKLIQEEGLSTSTEAVEQDEVLKGLSYQDSLDLDKFTKLISNGLSKNNASFADSLAEIYIKYGEFGRVRSLAKMLEKVDNRQSGGLYYTLMNRAQKTDESSFYAERVRLLLKDYADQGDLDAKAMVAMTYISTSNPMQGVMLLREVIAENENHEEGLFNLGILSIQSGQYEKAILRFEKLLDVAPNRLMAKVYLGISYFENGRLEEAKEIFTKLSNTEDESVLRIVDEYLQKLK